MLIDLPAPSQSVIPQSLPPASVQDMSQIQALLRQLLQTSFPELKRERIVIRTFQSQSHFFQSNFEPLSLLAAQPIYIIQVNPVLFERQLSFHAAQAILAHELSHTLDYQREGLGGLLNVAYLFLFDNSYYEHRTDIQAITRGFGPGLMAYREWIYRQIPVSHLSQKQDTYYKPAEIKCLIQNWAKVQAEGRADITLKRWLEHPPFLKDYLLCL